MSTGKITLGDQYRVTVDSTNGITGQWIDATGAAHTHATLPLSGTVVLDSTAHLSDIHVIQTLPGGLLAQGVVLAATDSSGAGVFNNGSSNNGLGFKGRAIMGDWGHNLQIGDPGGTMGGWCLHIHSNSYATEFYTESGVTLGNNGTGPQQQIDGSGQVVVTLGQYRANATPTSVAAPTSGTVQYSQPFAGAAYKEATFYCAAYENDTTSAQTIAFPTAFTTPPIVSRNTSGLTVKADTTSLTLTAPDTTTPYTGWITVEGW